MAFQLTDALDTGDDNLLKRRRALLGNADDPSDPNVNDAAPSPPEPTLAAPAPSAPQAPVPDAPPAQPDPVLAPAPTIPSVGSAAPAPPVAAPLPPPPAYAPPSVPPPAPVMNTGGFGGGFGGGDQAPPPPDPTLATPAPAPPAPYTPPMNTLPTNDPAREAPQAYSPAVAAAVSASSGDEAIRKQLQAKMDQPGGSGNLTDADWAEWNRVNGTIQDAWRSVDAAAGVPIATVGQPYTMNPVAPPGMVNLPGGGQQSIPTEAPRYDFNSEVVDAQGNLAPSAEQQSRTIGGVTTPYRNPDANPGAMQADPETLRLLAEAKANGLGGGIDPSSTTPNIDPVILKEGLGLAGLPGTGGDFPSPRTPTPTPSGMSSGGVLNPKPAIPGGDGPPVPDVPPSPPDPTLGGIPSVGGGSGPATQPFGPGGDLRSTQINPTPSASLSNMDTLVSNAAGAVGQGKSRGDIAQGYLDAFDSQAQPKIRDQIRAVGQRAASLGRIGMGDTAVETLQPYTDYLTNRAAYAKQLASDSASGDITDRLNNLGALSGVQGQTYGQESSARNELRGERDYQSTTARQAIQDAIQQYLMEQQSQAQDFNQGATEAGIGYGNSPSNLFFGAGQQYGNQAGLDFASLAQLLAPYLNK